MRRAAAAKASLKRAFFQLVPADAKPGDLPVARLSCLGRSPREVERPVGCEGFAACQVLSNSECARARALEKGGGC